MVCVVRQEVYQLVLALCMFVVSVQGVARTTIFCGESGGVVGQPQVLSCNISGSIENNIYWYRYNTTYNENIVQCSKSSAESVSTCVAPPNLRSKYNVSIEDQPPRKPSFTIISVSAEDLEVSWLCVDNITFPDRASIPVSSNCSLKQAISKIQKKQNDDEQEVQEKDNPNSNQKLMRSCLTSTSVSSSGVFDKVCLFCRKSNRKHQGHKQKLIACVTKTIEKNIQEYATILQDENMLKNIQDIDFIAKEIHYHAMCRIEYQRRAEKMREVSGSCDKSEWHDARNIHAKAFDALCSFVTDVILEKQEVYPLNSLLQYYQSCLLEFGGGNYTELGILPNDLQNKLVKFFGDNISIDSGNKRRGNIVFSKGLNVDDAVRKAFDNARETEHKVRDVAFLLRREIFSTKKIKLPENLTIQHIINGEIAVPDMVSTFFTHLLAGPYSNRGKNKVRRIHSISQDVIYSVTGGRTKPSKHLQLGLAMKSLTGSKKVIEILNRLGHTLSYNSIEELETELTFTSTERNLETPSGMILSPHLSTGVAFDNYDRFVETLSGKDTLHDTVGIAFQDFVEADNQSTTTAYKPISRKRRRTFEACGLDLEPYRKKPRMLASDILPLSDSRRSHVPESYQAAYMKDILWMISQYISMHDTPMWVGWNSMVSNQTETVQKIWYLPQINISPTSNTVVVETLRRALKIADECGKTCICVTYDLAIAKVALQIQAEESPTFDSVFVQLGAFHIELAFFKAVGKFIAESGGPYLLTECGVLASGSLNGFISGKHYNRCKRVHQLLALSMEILHFRSFYYRQDIDIQELRNLETEVKAMRSAEYFNECAISMEMQKILTEYKHFTQETLDGNHGLTAKYWMIYIEMIHLYHEFSRSIRTGDYELYIHCLPKLTNYFFTFNQPNYARWLVRFHDNLLKLKDTHPELDSEFRKGRFALKRTGKPFSRMPVDLTLEQTINADAASQRTGISPFTNSISARQRWANSHSMRISILSNLFNELGLDTKEDISRDLKPNQMQRNARDVESIILMSEQLMNPFTQDETNHQFLFNIGSAKAATIETKEFLLNVPDIGQRAREKFISECADNSHRFEERIQRQKLCTFSTEGLKTKGKTKAGIIKELQMERDLFGRILCIALERRIDMAEVLKYPLTPMPLSLCHVDGSILKTPKVTLMKALENRIASKPPSKIDCIIVDGLFFLHLMQTLPSTFGGVSRCILQRLCDLKASRIELVFDRTITPSIKDCERNRRAGATNRELEYDIVGPVQRRPADFLQALRNDKFKEALIAFLVMNWQENGSAIILKNKEVFVTCQEKCFSFRASNGKVLKTEETALESQHEEADSRMIFHLNSLVAPSNVVIRTADTDVLIILLGNLHLIVPGINVWLEVGLYSKNTLRYINVNELHKNLGTTLSKSLPAYHALTGCDYTASFSRKGKVRPLKLLEKAVDVQKALLSLGKSESIAAEVNTVIERFVCSIYGMPKMSSVDDLRLEIFLKKYKPKKSDGCLSGIKGIEASSLPPCSRVLTLKIKRANYICGVWTNASKNNPPNFHPENSGWVLNDDGMYELKWFEGDVAPVSVESICRDEDSDQESEDSDDESNISCSDDESETD